jgi:hypothetical protein
MPVRWTLTFNEIVDRHRAGLSVTKLTGGFGRGPHGWFFDRFVVQTPRSRFTLEGGVNNEVKPTNIDLHVKADRFTFQEWSGVLRGLKNIAIEASFDTSLKGSPAKLATNLTFKGNGGDISGAFTLDTTVPGWHGAGAVDVERFNLAHWMSRPDRPSAISGHVTLKLALELGRRLPPVYTFDGRHAMSMDYEGDDVHARHSASADRHRVGAGYGAHVTTFDGSIGLDDPFPFHFKGGDGDRSAERTEDRAGAARRAC